MNNNVGILVTFRVFDTIFTDVREAKELIKGWEHKEKVTTNYMVFDTNDIELKDFKKGIQVEELRGCYFYKRVEDARRIMEEWDEL